MSAFKRLTKGQHTPGPWRYTGRGPTGHNVNTSGTGGFSIVPHVSLTADEVKANARLIASAPDMLAILREVSAWLVCPATDAETVEQVKTAVDRVIAGAMSEEG